MKSPQQIQQALAQAYKAVLLDDSAKVLAQARASVSGHESNMNGVENPGDDVGIHIGDIVNQLPTPTITPASPTSAPSASPVKSGLSKLAAAGLVAASLATGVGIPFAIPAAIRLFSASQTVTPVPQQPAVMPPMAPKEFKVDFWVEDGKVKTAVTPVTPMK